MANMDYCRWENTLSDLEDCRDALKVMVENNDDGGDMSYREFGSMQYMMKVMQEIQGIYADFEQMRANQEEAV